MSQIPRDSFSPALIKPTYNVGDYGHDVIIPLNCITGSATTTLTPSTATFVQVLEDGKVPVDEVNQFITDSDKMELIHAGNDTDFDTTWEWLYIIQLLHQIDQSTSTINLITNLLSLLLQPIQETTLR